MQWRDRGKNVAIFDCGLDGLLSHSGAEPRNATASLYNALTVTRHPRRDASERKFTLRL